jgi:hypothetical protein
VPLCPPVRQGGRDGCRPWRGRAAYVVVNVAMAVQNLDEPVSNRLLHTTAIILLLPGLHKQSTDRSTG